MGRSSAAWVLIGAGLLFLMGSGCRRTAPAVPAAPSSTAAAPVVAAPADLGPAGPAPTSWSDPRVLAGLGKDCAFNPESLLPWHTNPNNSSIRYRDMDALSCQLPLDQSCTYDPCLTAEKHECRPRCTQSCRDCGQDCIAACTRCKSSCTDEGCRSACARSCADCRQTCLRTRDRCTTGDCTQEFRECHRKLKADWRSHGCAAMCRVYLACQRRCLKAHKDPAEAYEACTKPCQPKDLKGCDILLCGGSLSMGTSPEDFSEDFVD